MPKRTLRITRGPSFGLMILAAVIGLILFAALVAFTGVIAFHPDHLNDDDDGGPKIDTLSLLSGIPIITDSFGNCRNNVTIDNWRLQRVGRLVTFSLIGQCLNTSSVSSIDIDFNFSQFPNPYKTPSATGSPTDVVGTGSATESDGGAAAYVEVKGDTTEEEIDLDMDWEIGLTEGSDVQFSFFCQYELS